MSYFFDTAENAFLHSAIHENIPETAIEISDEQHAELLAGLNSGKIIENHNDKLVLVEQAVEIDLNSAKQTALNHLANKVDSLKSALMAGYPQAEIDSFYRQEFEARAYLNGDESNIAMIANIAKLRGVPLQILAEKVVQKADFIAGVIGQVLGVKQAFETRIENAENVDELNNIETEIGKWSI